jgi:hypothetical protein
MGRKFLKEPGTTKGTRVNSKRTICEVHRQIHDELVNGLLESNPDLFQRIEPLLEEAFELGIKLVKKLVEYKCSLPNWEKNIDKKEIQRIRKLRLELESKLRK